MRPYVSKEIFLPQFKFGHLSIPFRNVWLIWKELIALPQQKSQESLAGSLVRTNIQNTSFADLFNRGTCAKQADLLPNPLVMERSIPLGSLMDVL